MTERLGGAAVPGHAPLLIYDGDCAFCVGWIDHWRRLTGDAVRYDTFQRVASAHPQIPVAEFRRAIQYVGGDGRVASGAEATFRTLAHAQARSYALWLWLYCRAAPFAWLAERGYALVASHRGVAARVSGWLWGKSPEPARFELGAWLFLGGVALVNIAAFASLGTQIAGLAGADGLLPIADHLAAAARRYGPASRWLFPSLFWLDASDAALKAACWSGVAASALLLFGVAQRACLAVIFVLYLSLFDAGQAFTQFQWDLLLLETDFLALVLVGRPTALMWLGRWLLCRFMLMSGEVKWLGDPAWAGLSVLRDHFLTQPLPTPLAAAASRLPDALLRFGGAATLVIELVVPFFFLLPRRLRVIAAWATLVLQGAIVLTGNYGFFNLLVMVLCLTAFDDAAFRRVLPRAWAGRRDDTGRHGPPPRLVGSTTAVGAYTAFSVVIGLLQMIATWRGPALPDRAAKVLESVSPWPVVNRYGPFKALMHERPEIVIEGSRDGRHWQEYGFRFKPGDVNRRPVWNVPHQPRLDWQMWFAAQSTPERHAWFAPLLRGLLRNTPDVVGLLGDNPFAAAPPTVVRASLHDYRFGDDIGPPWWQRRLLGVYFSAVTLTDDGRGLQPLAAEQVRPGS